MILAREYCCRISEGGRERVGRGQWTADMRQSHVNPRAGNNAKGVERIPRRTVAFQVQRRFIMDCRGEEGGREGGRYLYLTAVFISVGLS